MPCSPDPEATASGSKPRPSSSTSKERLPFARAQTDHGAVRGGVLRDVLERLERAEVDGRLHVGGEPAQVLRVHLDAVLALAGLRLDRGHEPPVGEERRVDAAREVAEILERRLRLGLDLRRASPTLFAGSRSVSWPASRAFTASATSCCWAPSWMLRSRRRRSSSWAATRR